MGVDSQAELLDGGRPPPGDPLVVQAVVLVVPPPVKAADLLQTENESVGVTVGIVNASGRIFYKHNIGTVQIL